MGRGSAGARSAQELFDDILLYAERDRIVGNPSVLVAFMKDMGFARADVLAMRTAVEELPRVVSEVVSGNADPRKAASEVSLYAGVDESRLAVLFLAWSPFRDDVSSDAADVDRPDSLQTDAGSPDVSAG